MMSNKRRVYDREFKLRAVRLSMESSDLSRLATELGITSKILYKWRTALGNVESKQFPGHGNKGIAPFAFGDLKIQGFAVRGPDGGLKG